MKRAVPSKEPLDVSSDDSLSSDSDDDVVNAFGLPNASKVAPAKEGEGYSGDFVGSRFRSHTLNMHVLLAVGCRVQLVDF